MSDDNQSLTEAEASLTEATAETSPETVENTEGQTESVKNVTEAVSEEGGADASGAETTAEPKTALEALEQAIGKPKEEAGETKEKAGEQDEPPPERTETKPEPEAEKTGQLDEIYRVPQGMRGEWRKRFVELSNHAQAQAQSAAQYQHDAETLGGFQEVIHDSGATPEQLAQSFEFLRALNRGDAQGALAILDSERAKLATALGQPVPGVDLLADFPDLKQKVEELELSEQHALEVARARRIATEWQSRNQSQSQAQARADQYEQAKAQALAGIDAWIGQQKARDIDFAAKERYLSANLAQIVGNLPPTQWQRQIQLVYNALQVHAPQSAAKPGAQPLRPQSASAGQREPQTALQAMEQALNYQ